MKYKHTPLCRARTTVQLSIVTTSDQQLAEQALSAHDPLIKQRNDTEGRFVQG